TAVEEAIYLTNHASKVTLIHRRDELRAEKILQERLFKNPKVEMMWDSVPEEILSAPPAIAGMPAGVTGVRVKNIKTNETSDLNVDGVFIAIGHKPNTDIFSGQIKTDSEGYIETVAGSTATNIPGVFAAGDVQDKTYRQAVTAAGTGCMAALEAERFLGENE
ncbi:MAG: FAD-dependent oxidoreductase, partial [Rhodospirillaceae bacterium]|nr:FAD-dependent oxidoreductase [Rhodospirillaceae bacterium]